jgi:RND family efflux transporter MFP subunit
MNPLFLYRLRPYVLYSLLGLAALLLLAACQPKAAAPAAAPAPTVTGARPVVQKLVEWKEYTGRIDSNEDVEIRARVSGYLQSVHFTEGQQVQEGDLLFTIDQRPFQAEVARAAASLSQARAAANFARANLERGRTLIAGNAISKEELDQRTSLSEQAEANVLAAEAALRTAELDLSFTEIRSPISGIAGEHRVNKGNLINGGSADSTLLATIVPQNPVYVYFELDEASQLANLRRQFKGELPDRAAGGLPVELQLADESGFPHKGVIDFIDNRLNNSTATLRVRGRFDNAGGLLAPGLFARVRVPASSEYEALLIPDASIGTAQSVKYVWVVGSGSQARQQEIVLGPLYEGRRIVRSGLSPEDIIVVNGIQFVRPGSPLNVAMETTPAPAPSGTGERSVALK